MTISIPNNVLMFAGGQSNLAVYHQFRDYFNHYRSNQGVKGLEFQKTTTDDKGNVIELTFAEKEEKMNAALRKEILRVAGITNISDFPLETWAGHPTLRWAAFAVVNAMIDMIIPETLIDSIGIYAEIRTIGFGDSAS